MDYNNLSPEDRARFQAGSRELVNLAWSYILPVRIAYIVNDREEDYNTGTGILLRLGGEYMIGTAWHVFALYDRGKQAGEDVVLLVGDVPLEPPQVRFADRENDIVFLAIPEVLVRDLDAVPYDPGSRWPPRRVTTDDSVFFCGLPAFLRSDEGEGEILFGNMSLVLTVSSVAEHHFVLPLEREKWEDLGRVPLPGEDVFLGGLSGAPVFVMDDLSYPLVGLISAVGESLPLLYVASLSHVPAIENSGVDE
jgi:hypothetical protein